MGGDWLKSNVAGSGAYKVERYAPGEQVLLRRNDAWKCGVNGKPPFFERIIVQTVPESVIRANLIERGDADLCIDLGANDVTALLQRNSVKVISIPPPTGMALIAMDTRKLPFDNKLVRQAIATALPYEDMFNGGIFGRAKRLFGADWPDGPPTGAFPQPLPHKTDLVLAKAKLVQAGVPSGFKTALGYGVAESPVGDPVGALMQESLAKIGIQLELHKLPEADFATQITNKTLPMMLETNAGALFPSTDYACRIYLNGNTRWNYSSWDNLDLARLIEQARFEQDTETYEGLAKQMVSLVAEESPMTLLWQPFINAVMAKDIDGYTLRETRMSDFRDLLRT